MSSAECNCLDSISAYLLSDILSIIKEYLHNWIRECFYENMYRDFDLNMRLNKRDNVIEERKMRYLLSRNPMNDAVNNNIIITLETKRYKEVDNGVWLTIFFLSRRKRHSYSRCLTANITCPRNSSIPPAKHTYTTFCCNILRYLFPDYREVLLQEIRNECGVTPDIQDLDRICLVACQIILAHNRLYDPFLEIHR